MEKKKDFTKITIVLYPDELVPLDRLRYELALKGERLSLNYILRCLTNHLPDPETLAKWAKQLRAYDERQGRNPPRPR